MSTRCQCRVIAENKEDNSQFSEDITLYHHFDGVPKWMVPLFYKAYQFGITPFVSEWEKDNPNAKPTDAHKWQAFRAGYAASFLCHIDPRGFVPENSHQLHGDIEWYYKLYVSGKTAKGQEQRQWELEIYKAKIRSKAAPTLKIVIKRTPLCNLIDDAGKLKAEILSTIMPKPKTK